jgi:Peptidase S24-like
MRKRRKPPSDNPITQNILRLMAEQGLSDKELCLKCGMDSSLFSRKIAGDRKWTWVDIERIAPVLACAQPYDLFVEPQKVPLVRISGDELFDYKKGDETTLVSLEGTMATLENTYGLLLEDRSLMPGFPKGTRFLAQMKDWEEIKEDDLVVYTNPANKSQIYRISFMGEQILLKSLNPKFPDLLLPVEQVRLCDRIFRADF